MSEQHETRGLVLGIPYECETVTRDEQRYGLPTAKLKRADGFAGWLEITGPGADEMVPGRRYLLALDGRE